MIQEEDLELLRSLSRPLPRYTSYPTAPAWGGMELANYEERLSLVSKADVPLSIYVHIPFCHSMCLYCACSVVLNRKPENEERYVENLCKEIDLVTHRLGKKKKVRQLHFGGGTPTKLTEQQLERIFRKLHDAFDIEADGEIAIEIDPRTVVEDEGRKLEFLKEIGYNRVSLGVQDVDSKVQEAVKRRQSYEVTRQTFLHARRLGFSSINIDLIYGLPFQTIETFTDTIQKVIGLSPDRVALFSYAKVPWLKPHQKAIKDDTLPSTEEKFHIYLTARAALQRAGYRAIGMDHFAKEDDELSLAFKNKTLHRNFQGYTVFEGEDLVGFGMTSIGYVGGAYVQNCKDLSSYYASIEEGKIPMERGKILSENDHIRRFVIQRLMCHFYLNKEEFQKKFHRPFNHYFAKELEQMSSLSAQGLVADTQEAIIVTPKGELFVRNIAATFDAYLSSSIPQRFSQSI